MREVGEQNIEKRAFARRTRERKREYIVVMCFGVNERVRRKGATEGRKGKERGRGLLIEKRRMCVWCV